jgi:hypothetical protein
MPQANLMQVRLGVSVAGTVEVVLFAVAVPSADADVLAGFATHANEMHLFFSRVCTADSFVWAVLGMAFAGLALGGCVRRVTLAVVRSDDAKGLAVLDARRGLGELVLAGVVMPVEHVSSAVDVRLLLLTIDRRLRIPARASLSFTSSSSELLCSAMVRRDS